MRSRLRGIFRTKNGGTDPLPVPDQLILRLAGTSWRLQFDQMVIHSHPAGHCADCRKLAAVFLIRAKEPLQELRRGLDLHHALGIADRLAEPGRMAVAPVFGRARAVRQKFNALTVERAFEKLVRNAEATCRVRKNRNIDVEQDG